VTKNGVISRSMAGGKGGFLQSMGVAVQTARN